jgi:hypothetical protein
MEKLSFFGEAEEGKGIENTNVQIKTFPYQNERQIVKGINIFHFLELLQVCTASTFASIKAKRDRKTTITPVFFVFSVLLGRYVSCYLLLFDRFSCLKHLRDGKKVEGEKLKGGEF